MKEYSMFVNCSNHPSAQWSPAQKEAAEKYGKIRDVRFPEVDPSMSEEQIRGLAEHVCRKILACRPAAVMCQGEFTLTYAIVRCLRENNIKTVAACSRRMVKETAEAAGSRKEVYFQFERFREYR